MALYINTSRYEFSTGHKPRGLGTWAFAFNTCTPDTDPFIVRGTPYSTALRLAKAEARARHAYSIIVLP